MLTKPLSLFNNPFPITKRKLKQSESSAAQRWKGEGEESLTEEIKTFIYFIINKIKVSY